MKLKFRADKDDIMIFIVFAIFLLYIVAIGIVNLHSFATEGYFSGLNPLPAFAPKFLWMTLTLLTQIIGPLRGVEQTETTNFKHMPIHLTTAILLSKTVF